VTRTVPISVLLHATFLALFALFASFVPQQRYEAQRVMRVRLAHAPEISTRIAQPEQRQVTVAETPPQLAETPRKVEPLPNLPPKLVPKETKRENKPTPTVAQTTPSTTPKKAAAEAPAGAATATAAGPAVSGTDVDFPFAWYLDRIQGIIVSRWSPHQLGFREGSQRRCVVHFFVDRRGKTNQVVLTETSGVAVFDREALRAVKDAPLPPLPAQYTSAALGVSFIFTLEPGI
jgi:TonB family protein